MILDAHMHLGECRVFDNDVSEQALMDALDRNQVDAAIVQPFPGAPDPRAVHDRIANLAAKVGVGGRSELVAYAARHHVGAG